MKMRYVFAAALLFVFLCVIAVCVADNTAVAPPSDAFDESGNPRRIMKTMNQIEPRTVIDTLPFSITNSGSYYLAKNLRGVASSNGIIIDTHSVQIDLNGFVLIGTNGSGHGILATTNGFNAKIYNGAIVYWDGWGIMMTNANDNKISNIKCFANAGGIGLGDDSVVENTTSSDSQTAGIIVGDVSSVTDSRASNCQGNGIRVGFGSRVIRCSAMDNQANGIVADHYCTIKECLTKNNTTNGIVVGNACIVANNNCGNNGQTAMGAGILTAWSGNRIINNNLVENYCGIRVGNSFNRLEGNSISYGTLGIEDTGNQNFIVRNTAGAASATNFHMAPISHYGIIITNAGPAFTNESPWANFQLTP